MSIVRTAGIVTGVYAAAYGLPAAPVSLYVLQKGRLPSFWGLFDMYGGPWSARVSDGVLVALLLAFLAVNLAVALSAWLLWKGRSSGGVLNLALLPVEAVFWVGLALPVPWLIGIARVVLVAAAWRSLKRSRGPATS